MSQRTYSQTQDYSYAATNPKRQKTAIPAKKRSVPKVTRTAIQRAIAASRETKEVVYRGLEAGLLTVSPNSLYPYSFPVPSVGTSSVGRIGNHINPTGLEMKYLIHNNSNQTIYARVLCLRVKQGYLLQDTAIDDALFEGTGGTDVGCYGDLRDVNATVDRGEYVVMYDRVHVLGYDVAGYSSPNPRVAIGKAKLKPLKNMHFEDITALQPVTDRYVMLVIPRRVDADESLGEGLELSWDLSMQYKD